MWCVMSFHVTLYNGIPCVVHRSLCLLSPRFPSLFANHEAVLCGHKEQPPLSALYRALRTRSLQWRRQANTSMMGFLFGWWYQGVHRWPCCFCSQTDLFGLTGGAESHWLCIEVARSRDLTRRYRLLLIKH